MNFKGILSGLICILLAMNRVEAQYQRYENDPVIEQIIESVAEHMAEDFDYSELKMNKTSNLNIKYLVFKVISEIQNEQSKIQNFI